MEVKDKLKPYLGTKTILIIDSEEDWLQLYFYLELIYSKDMKKRHDDLCIDLGDSMRSNLKHFETIDKYKSYNFIHSKDLLNTTRKYNLWKLKLTTS